MPIFQCTFFFEFTQDRGLYGGGSHVGWSETWYRSFTDIETAIAALQDVSDLNSYLRWRLPLLPIGYNCVWVRASSTSPAPATRLTKVANVNNEAGGGSFAIPANGVPAQTTCALLIDLTAIVGTVTDPGPPVVFGAPFHSHRRPFLLRGLPGPFTSGNIFQPNAQYRTRLSNFLSVLARRADPGPPIVGAPLWLIRYINSAAAVSMGTVQLPAPPAPPRTFSITQPAVPLTVGQRVRVRGATSPLGLNRTWTVIGTTVAAPPIPALALLGTSRRDLVGTPNGAGLIRLETFAYAPATNVLIVGLRSRKIGRPSHPLRGRRSPAR